VREPLALLWKLIHARPFRGGRLLLSEATACLLWHWRARGMLDPEDPAVVPSADAVAALVLYVTAAPDTAYRRTLAVARKLLTSLTLRDKALEAPGA